MHKISYVFFNTDDAGAEPMCTSTGRERKILRAATLPIAVAQATLWITNQDETLVHIFEDDGMGIAPVLTMKRYENGL